MLHKIKCLITVEINCKLIEDTIHLLPIDQSNIKSTPLVFGNQNLDNIFQFMVITNCNCIFIIQTPFSVKQLKNYFQMINPQNQNQKPYCKHRQFHLNFHFLKTPVNHVQHRTGLYARKASCRFFSLLGHLLAGAL